MIDKKKTPELQGNNGGSKDINKVQPISVNPKFDELGLIGHIKKLDHKNTFPIEVFPADIQEIIKATNDCLNYPIEFTSAAILFASSVAIGNTFSIEIKNGYRQSSVIYIALVGSPGTNKSHPLSFAIRPLEKKDAAEYFDYSNKMKEYRELMKLTKKERKESGRENPIKPRWKQTLVTDFTPEALDDTHNHNKRGIGVYVDELASWFNNFNRYNKASEEQSWLRNWSGKPLRVIRKSSEPIFIKKPFISVAGTIQPSVLNQLANGRTDNGFLDRILFVTPRDLKQEYWSHNELPTSIFNKWDEIVNGLLSVQERVDEEYNPAPIVLKLDPDARKLIFQWQRENTDKGNTTDSDSIKGIHAKTEQYALRFALILERLSSACRTGNDNTISLNSIKGSIKLAEYFANTAIAVRNSLTTRSVIDKLPADKKDLYESLPDTFTRQEGLRIAKSFGIPESTFKRFLNKEALFGKRKQGHYFKKIN